MVDKPVPEDVDLETFLRSVGQSFTDAQKALVPGLEIPVNMMLSNAELELKVAVSSDAYGKMAIRPISSEDISRSSIDSGMISTIRINLVSSIGEIKTQPQSISVDDSLGKINAVPNLVGLTMEEAAAMLEKGGWQFELHAAKSEEVSSESKESRGRVMRQQPPGAQPVDKTITTVQLWIELGNIPVREVDGIGDKLGEKLSSMGIPTVGELGLSDVNQVASALHISEKRAKNFIEMAYLMSRLAVLGFRDEVVELLVTGAGIRSMEQLSQVEPEGLHHICEEAVSSGKVRVPHKFSFTVENVKSWIKIARDYIR